MKEQDVRNVIRTCGLAYVDGKLLAKVMTDEEHEFIRAHRNEIITQLTGHCTSLEITFMGGARKQWYVSRFCAMGNVNFRETVFEGSAEEVDIWLDTRCCTDNDGRIMLRRDRKNKMYYVDTYCS